MISFYPGPSQLYSQVHDFMREAAEEGFLSINHRSKEFVEISRSTIEVLKDKLNIPSAYTVFFVSSATECWEIIAQSLIKKSSFHISNGAFAEKWYEYTNKLLPDAKRLEFPFDLELNPQSINIPAESEIICITQNETSNGTQITNEIIQEIKNKNPQKLIAIDATSSMAGIYLDFDLADVWFASVQKCFGLPAGLGLMICSPAAIEKAMQINDTKYYNSLLSMLEKMKDWQTSYTPNVLNIYLLGRVLQDLPNIKIISQRIENIAIDYYNYFREIPGLRLLVKDQSLRSATVIAIEGEMNEIKRVKEAAKEKGFLLGNGYGKWKDSTFRIANFPAIADDDINNLKKFFKSYK